MEKVLVTGANGYLGACIFEELAKDNTLQLTKLSKRLGAIESKSLEYDTVIHCAAALRNRPDELWSSNAHGTIQLLNGFKNTPRILYISSKSVYGLQTRGIVNENTQVQPNEAYGQSKYAAERSIIDSRLNYLILRAGTLYGYGHQNPGFTFPTKLAKQLAAGQTVSVYEPDPAHDYLYVWDLARMVAQLLKQPQAWNEVYNAAGAHSTIRQLTELTAGLAQPQSRDTLIETKRQTAPVQFLLDSSKLIRLLNFSYTPAGEVMEQLIRQTR